MIKALFDTNVLVSGFASFKHPTRPPAQLLHLWQAGFFELCTKVGKSYRGVTLTTPSDFLKILK